MISMRTLVIGLSPISFLLAGSLSASAGNATIYPHDEWQPSNYARTIADPLPIWSVSAQNDAMLNRLRLLGYKNVHVEYGPRWKKTVVACLHNDRVRLRVSGSGTIGKLSYIGRCTPKRANLLHTASIKSKANNVSAKNIRIMLSMSGYKQVVLGSTSTYVKTAQACRSDKLMRLDLDKGGKVIRINRIGTCANERFDNIVTAAIPGVAFTRPTPHKALKPVRAYLRAKGYNRMDFTDRTPPFYKVEACLQEKKMRINMRDSGSIIKVSRIGTCSNFTPKPQQADPITTAAIPARVKAMPNPLAQRNLKSHYILTTLKLSGYKSIIIKSVGMKASVAEACQSEKRMRLDMDRNNNVVRRSRIGTCKTRKMRLLTTASIAKKAKLPKSSQVFNMLALSGYKNIQINDKAKTLKTAQACRSDKLMRLDLNQDGKVIRVNRIGTCANERFDNIVTAAIPGVAFTRPTPRKALKPIRAYLRAKGYNRMEFTDRTAPFYKVEACLQEKKMRIDMRDSGSIIKVSRIGTCSNFAPQLKKADPITTAAIPARVKAKLKSKAQKNLKSHYILTNLKLSGYKRINIKSVGQTMSVAQVCQSEKKMRLDMDRNNNVVRKSRIGTCSNERFDNLVTATIPGSAFTEPTPRKALKPIRAYLRSKGYNRMAFTDRTAPFYKVEACLQEKKMRIDMRDSGSIIRVSRIGTCSHGAPQADDRPTNLISRGEKMRMQLSQSGYENIKIRTFGMRGYAAKACKGNKQMRVDMTEDANIIRISRIGYCENGKFAQPKIRTVAASHIMTDAPMLPAPTRMSDAFSCGYTFQSALTGQQIRFRTGSARIASSSRKQLDRLAEMMTNCKDKKIVVGGYSDSDGSKRANLRMSKKRASAVVRYLVKRGVPASQMAPVGFGEINPVAPNDSASNKALNRRVEFTTL